VPNRLPVDAGASIATCVTFPASSQSASSSRSCVVVENRRTSWPALFFATVRTQARRCRCARPSQRNRRCKVFHHAPPSWCRWLKPSLWKSIQTCSDHLILSCESGDNRRQIRVPQKPQDQLSHGSNRPGEPDLLPAARRILPFHPPGCASRPWQLQEHDRPRRARSDLVLTCPSASEPHDESTRHRQLGVQRRCRRVDQDFGCMQRASRCTAAHRTNWPGRRAPCRRNPAPQARPAALRPPRVLALHLNRPLAARQNPTQMRERAPLTPFYIELTPPLAIWARTIRGAAGGRPGFARSARLLKNANFPESCRCPQRLKPWPKSSPRPVESGEKIKPESHAIDDLGSTAGLPGYCIAIDKAFGTSCRWSSGRRRSTTARRPTAAVFRAGKIFAPASTIFTAKGA